MKVVLPTDNNNNNNLLPHRYFPLRYSISAPSSHSRSTSSLLFYQQQQCVAITHGPKQICNSSDGNSIDH